MATGGVGVALAARHPEHQPQVDGIFLVPFLRDHGSHRDALHYERLARRRDPLTYSWALGDGATASQPAASHVYTADGTYHATISVSDGRGGTATAEATVSVRSLTGAWQFRFTGGAGTGLETLTLIQTGTSLAGSFYGLFPDERYGPYYFDRSVSGSMADPKTVTITEAVDRRGCGSGPGTYTGRVDYTLNTCS